MCVCASVLWHFLLSFHILVSFYICSNILHKLVIKSNPHTHTCTHYAHIYTDMYKVSFTWASKVAGHMLFLMKEVSYCMSLDFICSISICFSVYCCLSFLNVMIYSIKIMTLMLNQFHGNGSRKFIRASFISTPFYRRVTSSMQNIRT